MGATFAGVTWGGVRDNAGGAVRSSPGRRAARAWMSARRRGSSVSSVLGTPGVGAAARAVSYRTQLLFVRCSEGFERDRLLEVLRALSLVLEFEMKE